MKILIGESDIQARISEMAKEIDEYYLGQEWYKGSQKPVIVIGVLTGALFFVVDLIRKLSIRTELDFIRTSTYPGKAIKAREPKIITGPAKGLQGAHVLLVDDILDTGKTLKKIHEVIFSRNSYYRWAWVHEVKTAVLLRKPGKPPDNIIADFVGFDIPDKFVVGNGLDYNGRYREKPYVAVWSEDAS